MMLTYGTPTKVRTPKIVPDNLTPETVYNIVQKVYKTRYYGFVFRIVDDNGHILLCQQYKDNNLIKQDWQIVERHERPVKVNTKRR